MIEMIFKIRMLIYRKKYLLTFLGNFLDSLGPLVVLVVGGYLVMRGEANVSALVVFISGFQKISSPWDQLINFYRSVSNARVTYRLVAEAIDGPGVAAHAPQEALFRRTNDEVQLQLGG
jgi:ABC-type bacteriocin/lantibiotic exporter with double-glycine peptidase domain